MSRLGRIGGSVGRLAAGTLAVRALSIGLAIALARLLGPADFGVFISLMALCEIAGLVSDMGVGVTLSRNAAEVTEADSIEHLATALRVRAFLSLIVGGVMFASLVLVRGDPLLQVGLLLWVYVVANGVMVVLRQWTIGRMRVGLASVSLVVSQLVLVALACAVLASGGGIVGLAFAEMASAFAGIAVLYVAQRHLLSRPRGTTTAPGPIELIGEAWPLGLAGVLAGVYSRFDTVIVALLAGDVAAGLYGVAYQPFLAVMSLAGVAYTVLVPAVARAKSDRFDESQDPTIDAMGLVAFAGWTAALAMFGAAGLFVLLLFGPGYAESVAMVQVLALAMPAVFCSNVLMASAVAARRSTLVLWVSALGVIGTIGLDLIVVRRFGAMGAAVVTVAIEIVIVMVLAHSVRGSVLRGLVFPWVRTGALPAATAAVVLLLQVPAWCALLPAALMAAVLVRRMT